MQPCPKVLLYEGYYMYFPLPQSVMTYSYGVRHKQMPPSSGGYLSQGSILAVVIFFFGSLFSATRYQPRLLKRDTVEPRFNEPLYNEDLGITNDIFQPSNSVMYGKEPRYNEPISPVPWHFVKSRFHCTTHYASSFAISCEPHLWLQD